ncbi:hypothetical protein L861_06450 [Litchfieldella anticariensis FP35 = DSM 16096]|uniref:Uncharacterized protein n=1 Tax=Litchfieldella anticariensis (strain DSM 16096 / CECT 5854 / CIP 108499 / LMG 22089 / FP35) TaxID=1121939 RepID=S2KYU7_LITA3|nr:hypothetical protein [Halomonas anticariensis]EPC00574.1 hypothetical protein L861_06450 [Halomonas anticariensis FP35 = DSM 16096]
MSRFVPNPYAIPGALIREDVLREQFSLIVGATRWEYQPDEDPADPWLEVRLHEYAGRYATVSDVVASLPKVMASLSDDIMPRHAVVMDRFDRHVAIAVFRWAAFQWLLPPASPDEEAAIRRRMAELEDVAHREIVLADNFSTARLLRGHALDLNLHLMLAPYYRPYVRRELEALQDVPLREALKGNISRVA